jgi:CubicO group peptidase (beta-lactamase class C family)
MSTVLREPKRGGREVRGIPRLAALVAVLVLPAVVSAQQPLDLARFERAVLAEMEARAIPGVAVAMVDGDRIVYRRAFGIADMETRTALQPEMLFRAASVTKMFTAAAVLSLAEAGRIDLHAPIGRYIPGLSPGIASITAHQLLSHTGGLAQRRPMIPDRAVASPQLLEAAALVSDDFLFTEPGRVFSYANPGYLLAGALIEAVTRSRNDDYVAAAILRPLGMHASAYVPDASAASHGAQGHDGDGTTLHVVTASEPPFASPWGGLISNVEDLATFAIAFMNPARDGGSALSAQLVTQMATPYTPFPSDRGHHGYGLRIYDHRGLRVVEHGGQGQGFGSLLYMVPAHRFAVVILANRFASGRLYGVVDTAIDLLLDAEPSQPLTAPGTLPISAAEMAGLAGTYANADTVEVFVRDGRLVARLASLEAPLYRIGADRFSLGPPLAGSLANVLTFMRGSEGGPEYLYRSNMVAYRKTSSLEQPPGRYR